MDEPPSKKARMENNHECDSDKKENGDQASASQDMFENSIEEGDESSGVPISQIQSLRNNYTLPSQYPSPHPGPGHTVCVQLPLTLGLPSPYPHTLRDVWDNHHVRLPWSKENLYPVEDVENKGKKVLRSRWDLIIEALTKNKITNSLDLEDAILTYNTRLVLYYSVYASLDSISGTEVNLTGPSPHFTHCLLMSLSQKRRSTSSTPHFLVWWI